jgi:hypothetical protein
VRAHTCTATTTSGKPQRTQQQDFKRFQLLLSRLHLAECRC